MCKRPIILQPGGLQTEQKCLNMSLRVVSKSIGRTVSQLNSELFIINGLDA